MNYHGAGGYPVGDAIRLRGHPPEDHERERVYHRHAVRRIHRGSHGSGVIKSLTGAGDIRKIESGMMPDLVLLDVMMPLMNGYEVSRFLPGFEKIPNMHFKFIKNELPSGLLFRTIASAGQSQTTGMKEGGP